MEVLMEKKILGRLSNDSDTDMLFIRYNCFEKISISNEKWKEEREKSRRMGYSNPSGKA